MWKMVSVWFWAALWGQEGEKDTNATVWLLWRWWQFASTLSIYDFILQLIPFATEEAAFPCWYLILWQIPRWWDPRGTNKWVSRLSVLLCWHRISQHFTNFPGLCFSQLQMCTGSQSVRASEVYSDVNILFCLLILHPFDAVFYSISNATPPVRSSFQCNCISPVPPPSSLSLSISPIYLIMCFSFIFGNLL